MLLRTKLLALLFLLPSFGVLAQNTATGFFNKALDAEDDGDLNGAITFYTSAIGKNPAYEDAYFNRGWCYISTTRFNEAARDFTKVIETAKSFPGVFSGRAYARFQLGYYTDAVADYLQEIKNPRNPEPGKCHNDLGAAYEKLRQYDKALEHYAKAIEILPNYSTAINNRNQLMQLMVAQRQGKVNKKPMLSAKEYYDKGYEAGERSEYETAIQYFDRAIEIDHNMKLAYDNRGWAKLMLGRHREALADLDRSLELGISKWSYSQRGQVKMRLNDAQSALRDFEQALRLDPEHPPAKQGLESAKAALNTRIDTKGPQIEITAPVLTRGMEIMTLDQEVTITGKATDESGVRSVMINGIAARLNSGEFDSKVKVGNRTTVVVVATDFKGNSTEKQLTISPPASKPSTESAIGQNASIMGKNYALLIGTDEYMDRGWSRLNNPIADVKAVKGELGDYYNFQTEMITNPTKAQIIAKLREYAQKTYQTNDQLFIFVAGHGYFDEEYKEGFIVPTDGVRDADPFSAYLPHVQMRSLVNNINCKHTFLVMDVCFGGTIDPLIAKRGAAKADNVSTAELIARKMRFKTRRYLTSGGKEYVSDGQAGKHSPFVRNFLEALRTYGGSDKVLTIDDIIPYFERITPRPRYGELDDNEAGSDFIFIAK